MIEPSADADSAARHGRGLQVPLRAEFADSLEHPDPLPLTVLPRRDADCWLRVVYAGRLDCWLRVRAAGSMLVALALGGRRVKIAVDGRVLRRDLRSQWTG
ncbi:hypothetical protein VPH35_131476 [Triticum aestivum]